MEKMELGTTDITQENIEKLIDLFPQVATEVETDGEVSKVVDFDALRELLGDVAEGQRERYQFTWPGKREAKAEARRPIAKTMIPCPEKSVNWDTTENLYIEGDNLEALKILRETYAGKVKLIYIDPPYNTGHDFVYDDDFAQAQNEFSSENGEFDEEGGHMVTNTESNGRFHSDWCSMMYPRLLLARDFLTDDGAIFISIDESENKNLRAMADEIFGSDNFIAEIIWSGGRKNDSKYISVSHEYVLCYAKSTSYLTEHGIKWRKKKDGLEDIYSKERDLRSRFKNDYAAMSVELKKWFKSLPEDHPSKAHKHYAKIDEKGVYFPDNISWPGGGGPKYEVLHPVTKRPVAVPSRGWLFGSVERMNEIIADGKVEFGEDESKVPCYKRYLSETEYEAPYSVIYKDGRGASKRLASLMGTKVFDNPKDEDVIEEFISYLGFSEGIVMDFFSGSGTTAHSVFLRNARGSAKHNFILVQLPESLDENLERASKQSSKKVIQDAIALCDRLKMPHEICSIAEARIKKAGEAVSANADIDFGFRVMRIDSSNFKNASKSPEETSQVSILDLIDNVKEGRSELDMLFEVLPKFRIPYSAAIEERDIAGKHCFIVNDGQLIACFDTSVGAETIEAIAKMQPLYAVMRDASMADDSTFANFEELFKTYSPDTVRRVI